MVVEPGVLLGHYQIGSRLGRGGMGIVYRGRDTRLRRDVAVKVLPPELAMDSERMARFEREAHLVASLNHPGIATIHGLEEPEGVRALVMELVEGPTLAERLRAGAMPLEEVLALARQMTEAIEYAHERGVIHRDLKPSNVKLTDEGAVKLLDFGLAKALEDAPPPEQDDSESPTLSARATRAGVILGTAAYMSPEQAKGKRADRRSDVWSFGAVLFEMLSGKRAFAGETASDTLAAVLKTEPEWSALPASTPPPLRRLIQRCLTKDPRRRVQSIGEARIVLEDAIAGTPEESNASVAPLWKRAVPWSVAGIAIFLGVWASWRPAPKPERTQRLSVELGADASLLTDYGPAATLSPDGGILAFAATPDRGGSQLYVRKLDQLQALPLTGTSGAHHPFFSPDGEWIAFFAGGKLKKVPTSGGAPISLCDALDDRGGTWSENGFIFFAHAAGSGLWRVSSGGGVAELLTMPDAARGESAHRWPQALPGGNAVLFTAGGKGVGYDDATLVVQKLSDGTRTVVQQGGYHGRYVPSGHLIYMHEGVLVAVPFDLNRLRVTGAPTPVVEGVSSASMSGGAQFALSDRGTLAFVSGSSGAESVPIQWMDAEGNLATLRAVAADYRSVRFSPDGQRIAVSTRQDAQEDIWVYDWNQDTLSRLTFNARDDSNPVWTPDGRRIAFASSELETSVENLYWHRADGTGAVERLTESSNPQVPTSWHPSGKFLAFHERHPDHQWDILVLPVEGDELSGWKPGTASVFLSTPFLEVGAAFSPDGRFIGYGSNESGVYEVYVRPFPGPGGKWQVSSGGGTRVVWSRNSQELFYVSEDRLWVVSYEVAGDSFRFSKPRPWSERRVQVRPSFAPFDLHPDGKRFAVLMDADEANARRDKVVFITNFFDELRRLAPPAKR